MESTEEGELNMRICDILDYMGGGQTVEVYNFNDKKIVWKGIVNDVPRHIYKLAIYSVDGINNGIQFTVSV